MSVLPGVLGSLLVEALQVFCYWIGKGAVWLMTGGRVRTAEEDDDLDFAWYGIARGRDGGLVASQVLVGLVGFALVVIGAVVTGWFINNPDEAARR
jgi:hypothetical protein